MGCTRVRVPSAPHFFYLNINEIYILYGQQHFEDVKKSYLEIENDLKTLDGDALIALNDAIEKEGKIKPILKNRL